MPGSPDGLLRLGVGAGGRGGSETAESGVQGDCRDLLQAQVMEVVEKVSGVCKVWVPIQWGGNIIQIMA